MEYLTQLLLVFSAVAGGGVLVFPAVNVLKRALSAEGRDLRIGDLVLPWSQVIAAVVCVLTAVLLQLADMAIGNAWTPELFGALLLSAWISSQTFYTNWKGAQ